MDQGKTTANYIKGLAQKLKDHENIKSREKPLWSNTHRGRELFANHQLTKTDMVPNTRQRVRAAARAEAKAIISKAKKEARKK
jgi:hypothetical protein